MSRDKKNLAGEVPVLIGPKSDDGEETGEESDSRGRSRSKGKAKANSATATPMMNGFADSHSTYSRFSPQPSSYHWQDRSESLAGSGKGWLRISDDSVYECGIENVLAEGSGAFMLYYERAVWGDGWMNLKEKGRETVRGNRMNGNLDVDDVDVDTDGDGDTDRFSIGSEETLRPRMKVVDLNGSVGSLVSEVGVGIMTQKKDGKGGGGGGSHGLRIKDEARGRESSMSLSVNGNLHAPLSSSAPSSKAFGPRIVRSVNARRSHSVGMNGSATPASETANGIARVNGTWQHEARDDQEQKDEYDIEDSVPWDMTASAPSVLEASNLPNKIMAGKLSSQMGLGSKSTKMTMQQPHKIQ